MNIPELRPTDFAEYLQEPTDEDREYAADAYDHLAGFCVQVFARDCPQLPKGNIRGGFRTITSLMKFAATLYPEQEKAESGAAAIYDLQGILLQSGETPRRFAQMPAVTNREVEDYFGLARSGTPDNLSDLYHFKPTSQGTLFIADDDHFARAIELGRAVDPDRNSNKQCKMAGVVEREIWPRAVHIGGETPELFASTLGVAAHS